ncbi:15953_t:CDS:2, partial [Rhizophagus irregularis]
ANFPIAEHFCTLVFPKKRKRMSKLNYDILYEIFQNLQDLINMTYSNDPDNLNKWINYKEFLRSQFSSHINSSLFKIIISHLSDNSIKILKNKNIIRANFQRLKLSYNYISFCKYFHDLRNVFPVDSKMLLKEEIYKLFISECSSIKCLNSDMAYYPILKYPGANISLSNLYELNCSTTNQDFYYGLAQICKSIEKLYVKVIGYKKSHGIVKLIEMQTQIKYVFIVVYCECNMIAQALEKHVNSIIHLEITNYTSVIHFLIPKLINLRYLKVLDDNYFELRKYYVIYLVNHHNLQALNLHFISLDTAINIIKNTNGNLWKIRIESILGYDKAKEYNQTIYKYCPNIKYVTIFLSKDGTMEELEKIFIKCQHLEAIYIDDKIKREYIDKFLNLLLELAPLTLCKIHISYITQSLKLFLINWVQRKGKKTLQFYYQFNSCYPCHIDSDIAHIVHKYGIKDFWNYYIT